MVWEKYLEDGQIITIGEGDKSVKGSGKPLKVIYEHPALLHVCQESRKIGLKRLVPAFENNFAGTTAEGHPFFLNPGVDALFFETLYLAGMFFESWFCLHRPDDNLPCEDLAIQQPAKLRYLAVKNIGAGPLSIQTRLLGHFGDPDGFIVVEDDGSPAWKHTSTLAIVYSVKDFAAFKKEYANHFTGPLRNDVVVEGMTLEEFHARMVCLKLSPFSPCARELTTKQNIPKGGYKRNSAKPTASLQNHLAPGLSRSIDRKKRKHPWSVRFEGY